MGKWVLAGIGELLWDVLEGSEELGGAPMNFAYHAGSLGGEGHAISTVGDDRRGKAALAELGARGVACDHITVLPGAVTGYVLARVDGAGVASYEFPDNVAWDNLTLGEHTLELAANLDAVCFGSLGQRDPRARAVIMDFLKRTGENTLKVFDMNLRQRFYTPEILRQSMTVADVVKLNDDELAHVVELDSLAGNTLAVLQALRDRYNLRLAVLTRGDKGSLLVSTDQVSEHPGQVATVVDTIGAGDSFTAATVLGLLAGMDLDAINDHANRVAAYVCSQQGAMAPLPAGLRIC